MIKAYIKKTTRDPDHQGYWVIVDYGHGKWLYEESAPTTYANCKELLLTARDRIRRNTIDSFEFCHPDFITGGSKWVRYFGEHT